MSEDALYRAEDLLSGTDVQADPDTGMIDLEGPLRSDGTLIELVLDRERGTYREYTAGEAIIQWGKEDEHDFARPGPIAADMDEMFGKDGKAKSLATVLTLPITSAKKSIVAPKSDHPRLDEIVEFVTDTFTRTTADGGMITPINDVVAQLVAGLYYRRTYHELVYTRREDRIVYSQIALRPQSTCKPLREKRSGRVIGFTQDIITGNRTRTINFTGPYQMVHVHGKDRDPIRGINELEVAYWCWRAKQKLRYLWFTYLENAALPRTIIKARNDEAAKKVAKAVAAVRNSGVVAIPADWAQDIKTLDVSGKGAGEYRDACKTLDSEAAGSILAGFTELAQAATNGTGSFALAKNDSDFYLKLLQGFAQEPADTITNVAIQNLVRYNYGMDAPVPQYHIGPINEEDASTSLELLKHFGNNTTSALPIEFFNDLVMEVGALLGMDLDALQAGIERKTAEIEAAARTAQQAAMAGAVGTLEAGAEAVAAAGAESSDTLVLP